MSDGSTTPNPREESASPPLASSGLAGRHGQNGRRRQLRCPRVIARHRWLTALVAALLVLTPLWWSFGTALTNPAFGNSLSARAAEWLRDHGGRSVVVWAENTWYGHHAPAIGGKLAAGAIPSPLRTSAGVAPSMLGGDTSAHGSPPSTNAIPAHLPTPVPLRPFVSSPAPGEGVWRPVGRTVDGVPAVYETFMRPDAVHTGVVSGVVWMDTTLLRAQLYSGSYIPGDGPWKYSAPITPSAATSLVAAFNGGFRMPDSQGGYYSEGRIARPLRPGAASLVIYRDGHVTVGAWDKDVTLTADVAAVRQNLSLLVNQGQPVPGLAANDTRVWGRTISNHVYVWRSGVGVTHSGALVYVGGPGLNITSLADVLVRAGAVRAMELDINTDWVDFVTWAPGSPAGFATPSNGVDLLPSMVGKPDRYFSGSWARDFITMSARSGP